MAKTIRKPMEVKIVYSDSKDEPIGEVATVTIHYGRTTEYGDLPRIGSSPIAFPNELIQAIRDIVFAEAEAIEEIIS